MSASLRLIADSREGSFRESSDEARTTRTQSSTVDSPPCEERGSGGIRRRHDITLDDESKWWMLLENIKQPQPYVCLSHKSSVADSIRPPSSGSSGTSENLFSSSPLKYSTTSR